MIGEQLVQRGSPREYNSLQRALWPWAVIVKVHYCPYPLLVGRLLAVLTEGAYSRCPVTRMWVPGKVHTLWCFHGNNWVISSNWQTLALQEDWRRQC